ncbi:MotA/TolQ/ExbB proton channel family protein [Rapidithrix thailandica]|uniref:MotA/TolQ/ExbB proton channel family protein n=1 Tax=Rapidithrix thailandica TaxID=413964 RepID=A0AAW9RYF5_9BACT
MTELLLETVFTNWINLLILIVGVVNALFLRFAYLNVWALKKELFEGESVMERFIREKTGQLDNIDDKIRLDFAKWERMYKDATKWYYLFSTTISIFPLLGIGGTILGIVPSILDFSQVTSSFSLALVSTLLGVAFAVIFKFFEGFISGNYTLVSERISILTGDVTKYLIEKEKLK